MKFTPEEMAYEPPEDTSDWVPVGRGTDAIFGKPPKTARTVRLDPDVAEFFGDGKTVNEVLRKTMALMKVRPANRGRRTA